MIDLLVQVPNLEFGFEIDLVIILRSQSIASFRAILAHHDDGRLQRSQAGEDEIKENKRVRIEAAIEQEQHVEHDPDDDNAAESDNKFPTPAELRDFIGQMLAKGELALELLLDVFGQQFVLLQTLDDLLIERREFANFTFERVFNVISAKGAEVGETNELVRVPVRPLRFDKFGERRPHVVADRAILRQECPATNLAIYFSRRGRFHSFQINGERSLLVDSILNERLAVLDWALMEEAEVPLEHLHEEIHHHAEHSGEKWISWVALSTAILAVLAAIAGLLSGSHANEAMMKQIESADQWAFYQAKGIKAAVLDAKMSLTGSTSDADREKAAKYSEEQNEIQKEAREKEGEAKQNFHQHEVFARGVTFFQIAIAIAAISALTKRRRYWLVSMTIGAIGCIFLILGFVQH